MRTKTPIQQAMFNIAPTKVAKRIVLRRKVPRFDVQLLIDRFSQTLDVVDRASIITLLADQLDVDPNLIRAKRNSGLKEPIADEWAIKCGYHPAQVWPRWGLEAR